MKLRCLLVDDEPLALRVLEKYARELPTLEVVASCADAFEAMETLHRERIDLLFLDINMPKLSGISLVKSLNKPPLVIFTTAYPEFAVEGFELEAVDYLLKPFSFERFTKAVNRAVDKLQFQNGGSKREAAGGHLIVKADKKLYKLDFQDIIYLEAYGDYVKIITKEKTLLTKKRLSQCEKELREGPFMRIHRSYIIALDVIQYLEGNQVKIADRMLPIGLTYKEVLLEKLNS